MTQELLLWDIAKEIKVSTIREALTLTLILFYNSQVMEQTWETANKII